MTAHHAGGYYMRHTDNGDSTPRQAGRRISYVYYFHREPRRFVGGDLLLYDTDYDLQECSTRTYSRLAPTDNTLVLFPSDSYHEITKVAPASGETLPFGDGRFTVNGWIHETRPPQRRRSSRSEAASRRPSTSAPEGECSTAPA